MSPEIDFTILGGSGWIGSALVNYLRSLSYNVVSIDRTNIYQWLQSDVNPGHVFYAIGITSDFRTRIHETIDAHVNMLTQVLHRQNIYGLTYLSSTRLYHSSTSTYEESMINVGSTSISDIYNLSKLLGESLVLRHPSCSYRVVRLSNVIGPFQSPNTFFGSLLSDAINKQSIVIHQSASSSKDYIYLLDTLELLRSISTNGKHRIYNVASGYNINNKAIAQLFLERGFDVSFSESIMCPSVNFPVVNIERISTEFFTPMTNPFDSSVFSGLK